MYNETLNQNNKEQLLYHGLQDLIRLILIRLYININVLLPQTMTVEGSCLKSMFLCYSFFFQSLLIEKTLHKHK